MTTTELRKDLANNKLFITREFAAPVETVWQAWTDSGLLDQWWAPKPWKANTKMMDFRTGGFWLYAMEGPDGEKHWARADFKDVVPNKRYEVFDAFCDEKGNINNDLPRMHWKVVFAPIKNGTKVDIEITFSNQEDLEKILEMGFQEGFAAAHDNLDELLAKS